MALNFIKNLFSITSHQDEFDESLVQVSLPKASFIVKGLNTAQKKIFEQFLEPIEVEAGQVIIEEGTYGDTMYIINKGKVRITKKDKKHNHEYSVRMLDESYCFGEMSLIEDHYRSASAVADGKVSLFTFNKAALEKLQQEHPDVHSIIIKNIAKSVCNHLRNANNKAIATLEKTIELDKKRIVLGLFITYIITLLAIYNLSMEAVSNFVSISLKMSIINALLLSFFSTFTILMMYHSKVPWSIYGFTIKNWKHNLKESLIWTALIIVLLTGIKWFMFSLYNIKDLKIIEFSYLFDPKYRNITYSLIVYILFIPLQELIFRGGLQGSLLNFLPRNRYRRDLSVIISALVFASTHSHMSLFYASSVFLVGLIWGVMYVRQRSLLGVTVSHILVGVWALRFLQIDKLVLLK